MEVWLDLALDVVRGLVDIEVPGFEEVYDARADDESVLEDERELDVDFDAVADRVVLELRADEVGVRDTVEDVLTAVEELVLVVDDVVVVETTFLSSMNRLRFILPCRLP